jgi:putative acetyltransferase
MTASPTHAPSPTHAQPSRHDPIRDGVPIRFEPLPCVPRNLPFEHSVEIARPASPQEWGAAATLLADYFDWLSAQFGLDDVAEAQPRAEAERDSLASVFDRPGAAFFVARQRRLSIGTVGLLPDPQAGTVELCRFYCRPAARGLGVGRRLLARALDEAGALGYSTVLLETCPETMASAVRLYEEHGFVRTPEVASVPVRGAVRYRLALAARS